MTLEQELRDAHEGQGNGGRFEDWLRDMANNPNGTLQAGAQHLLANINFLRAIIAADEISEENGARPQRDDEGNVIVDTVTCGTCGRSWNDALITGRTPAPSGRCPYEYIHDEILELNDLTKD